MGTDVRSDLTSDDVFYCARHPQVETVLRCGRCNTPICPRCLIQGPVGARCRDCANVSRLPTLDVKPIFLARGIGAALVAGIVVGGVWGYISRGSGFVGFFLIFIAIGIGWAIGESVSVATNRKRSTSLAACAVGGVVIAYLVHNLVAYETVLPAGDVWGFLAAGLAAVYAASRVRA